RAANLIQSKDPADGAEPIVITSNEYAVGLFNGDDGILRGNRAWFRGEEDLREVALSRLPRYLPAYATTIHRSQGSEYDKVLVILPPEESRILTRELLYVAVSRARSGVLLVGAENSLRAAINNSEPSTSGVPALLRK
ncbi:MAG: ATP-binding domain-containing protein, partial [Opitutae bacterium]|nr:ATP-binding domain-containing protein [Opitutae bacterium]